MKHINKTSLASIKITSTGSAILCLKSANNSCLYFENTEQLADAIKKRQIRVRQWIISVPDNQCIIKSAELPATGMEQAYRMLEFELSAYLPLPAEDLVYGFLPIDKNDNLQKVLVYILKVKSLEEVLERFKSIGIRPSNVMVDSIALQCWFRQDKYDDINEINLLFGRENLFVFTISENGLQRYEEISLCQDDLQSRRAKIIKAVKQFSGEFSAEKQIVLRIAANCDYQTEIKSWFVGDFNKIEFLELPQLDFFASETSPQIDYIYESVITQGLLETTADINYRFLNLLGGKALKKAEQKQLILNTAVTAVLGICLVFCLWLNFAVMNWRIQYACRQIAQEIAPIKHIAADVESKRQKVKAVKDQLSNRQQICEMFSQLYKYGPQQISISQLSYLARSDNASVNIKGQADTLSSAFDYSDAMKDSELLSNIQIINAQQIPRPGGSIVEFKAECTMKGI